MCWRSVVTCAIAFGTVIGLSARMGFASDSLASMIPQTAEVPMNGSLSLDDRPTLDTWTIGPGGYDPATAGPAPEIVSGAAIEMPGLPAIGGRMRGEVLYDGAGTTVFDESVRCEKFLVRSYRVLRVSGDVVVYASEEFKIENHASVVLDDGATLTVYIGKDATVQDEAEVNMESWDPRRVTFVNLGDKEFNIQNNSQVCASLISPDGGGMIQNGSDMYGWYVGSDLLIKNGGGLHVPEGGVTAVVLPTAAVLYD